MFVSGFRGRAEFILRNRFMKNRCSTSLKWYFEVVVGRIVGCEYEFVFR